MRHLYVLPQCELTASCIAVMLIHRIPVPAPHDHLQSEDVQNLFLHSVPRSRTHHHSRSPHQEIRHFHHRLRPTRSGTVTVSFGRRWTNPHSVHRTGSFKALHLERRRSIIRAVPLRFSTNHPSSGHGASAVERDPIGHPMVWDLDILSARWAVDPFIGSAGRSGDDPSLCGGDCESETCDCHRATTECTANVRIHQGVGYRGCGRWAHTIQIETNRHQDGQRGCWVDVEDI